MLGVGFRDVGGKLFAQALRFVVSQRHRALLECCDEVGIGPLDFFCLVRRKPAGAGARISNLLGDLVRQPGDVDLLRVGLVDVRGELLAQAVCFVFCQRDCACAESGKKVGMGAHRFFAFCRPQAARAYGTIESQKWKRGMVLGFA